MLTAILLGGRIRHAGSGDPSRYAQADDSSGRVADHMDEALATPAADPGDLAELAVKNAQLAVDTLSIVPPTGTLRLECEAQEGAALTQSREQSEARHLQVIELVAAASGRGR